MPAAASSPTRSSAASIRWAAVRGSAYRSAESSRARFAAPTGRGGTPGPPPATPRGAGPPPRRRASGRRAARSARRWGGPGRAASGSWWSCPTRWGRGTRRPHRSGTSRSIASTTVWAPNRLVSPTLATAGRWAPSEVLRRRGAVPGWPVCRHWAARAAPSASGLTAPTATRPSSVRITENSVPRSTRPDPHAPVSAGSASIRARAVPAGSPPPGARRTPSASLLGQVGQRVDRQVSDHDRAPALAHDRGLVAAGTVGLSPPSAGRVGRRMLGDGRPGRWGELEQRRVRRRVVDRGEAHLERRIRDLSGVHPHPQRHVGLGVHRQRDARHEGLGIAWGQDQLVGVASGHRAHAGRGHLGARIDRLEGHRSGLLRRARQLDPGREPGPVEGGAHRAVVLRQDVPVGGGVGARPHPRLLPVAHDRRLGGALDQRQALALGAVGPDPQRVLPTGQGQGPGGGHHAHRQVGQAEVGAGGDGARDRGGGGLRQGDQQLLAVRGSSPESAVAAIGARAAPPTRRAAAPAGTAQRSPGRRSKMLMAP